MIMNDTVSANAFLKRTTMHYTEMIKPRVAAAVSDCYIAERLLTTESTAAAHRRLHITDKRRSCRFEMNGISMQEPVKELYVSLRRFTPFGLEWARCSYGTRAPFHRISQVLPGANIASELYEFFSRLKPKN